MGRIVGLKRRPSGWLNVLVASCLLIGCASEKSQEQQVEEVRQNDLRPGEDGQFHVHPGEDIQRALNAAARSDQKTVVVHEGEYQPQFPSQAMIRILKQHDGISLIADGDVTLTASNAKVAVPGSPGYPAIVNHIVFFGDGVTAATVMDGFRLTGANGFVTTDDAGGALITSDADENLQPGMFFYSDGGAIKVFGSSSPRLANLVVEGNHSVLCGGGVSIENRGLAETATLFANCIFRDNHCPGTGAAVDVLENSVCEFRNCLFQANISNTGMDEIRKKYGLTYNPEHGCGALTVFPGSRVVVEQSTFSANWNGADDKGDGSTFRACIFWMNTATDGSRPGSPYEIDILNAQHVSDCWIHGEIDDLQGTLDQERNVLNAPDPMFDKHFQPQNVSYENVGYRPLNVR